jgi:hypothetical protein
MMIVAVRNPGIKCGKVFIEFSGCGKITDYLCPCLISSERIGVKRNNIYYPPSFLIFACNIIFSARSGESVHNTLVVPCAFRPYKNNVRIHITHGGRKSTDIRRYLR